MGSSFNIGVLAWNMDALRQSADSIGKASEGMPLFACTSNEARCRLHLESARVFTPRKLDSLLGYEGARAESIGHCRNLLSLASICIGPASPLVMLDDDVHPSSRTFASFRSAFAAYDLVQGSYSGAPGNNIYSLVFFFDFLADGKIDGAMRALCGSAEAGTGHPGKGLHSLAGGIAGISPALLGKNAFAPTRYRLEDHFFEFSSRFIFPSLRFMGSEALEGDIPCAEHDRARGKRTTALVDGYLLDVKSAIVEKYFYFRLTGKLQIIINGKHCLVRIGRFDLENVAMETYAASAVEKFKSAAHFYLKKPNGQAIESELSRIASLEIGDFLVPQAELEREWAAFEAERNWLSAAYQTCRRDGERIAREIA